MKTLFGVDSARLLILTLLAARISFAPSRAAAFDRFVEGRIAPR
jgi:hypothetical protein